MTQLALSLIPVLVLCTLATLWILTRNRRRASTEEIISSLHKGELAKIQSFVPHQRETDFFKTDQLFWVQSDGYQGLRRRRRNAMNFIRLCQRYVRDYNLDKRNVDYLVQRAIAIKFLALGSRAEEPFRLIWKQLPHVCALMAAYVYWEADARIRNLHRECGIGILTL
jgi:hypothetical protein